MKSLHLLIAGLTTATITLVQPFGISHWAFGQTIEKVKEEEVYLTDDETIDREREERTHQIARNTTIFIQNTNDPENFGSGVIVAKEGNTYAVLTAAHVLEADGPFTVKIKDEFQYPVKNIQKLPNIDLARLQFESDENFDVAPLGDFEQVREADEVHVAGYPTPGLNIQRPVFFTLPGNVTTIFPEAAKDGYSIAYSNFTRSGMSGGPVFNTFGHVIAIHGRKETNEDGSVPTQWVNLGIPISLYKQSIPIVRQHHPQHRHLWTHLEHRWVRPRFVHREEIYSSPAYQPSDHPAYQKSDPEAETEHKPKKPVQSKTKAKPKTKVPAQKTRLKAKPKTEAKVKPEVKPDSGAQPASKPKPKPKLETKDKAKPKVKPDFGGKSAREKLPNAKGKASTRKRFKAKPVSGTQPASKPKPKPKSETKDKAKPKVKPDFGGKSVREKLPNAKGKASTRKRSKAKPVSGTQPASKPKPKSKSKSKSKPKPKAKASEKKSPKVKLNSGGKSAKKKLLKVWPKTK